MTDQDRCIVPGCTKPALYLLAPFEVPAEEWRGWCEDHRWRPDGILNSMPVIRFDDSPRRPH